MERHGHEHLFNRCLKYKRRISDEKASKMVDLRLFKEIIDLAMTVLPWLCDWLVLC